MLLCISMAFTPYRVPVSSKGIVFENEKVWLRRNERNEWELPGGKVDVGERPAETVVRELQEELGFKTSVREIVSADIFTVKKSVDEQSGVLVITYLCDLLDKTSAFEETSEAGHVEFRAFKTSELRGLDLFTFYKDSIAKALRISGKLT